jgi:hypothetical protein
MNAGLVGWEIDGLANYMFSPIVCSVSSMRNANASDSYIVFAGGRVDIFDSNSYQGLIRSMDNTNGSSPLHFILEPSERNRAESMRVYFIGNEITFPGLS